MKQVSKKIQQHKVLAGGKCGCAPAKKASGGAVKKMMCGGEVKKKK